VTLPITQSARLRDRIGINRFAQRHRLKLVHDKSDDILLILGKGGQIYEYSDNELGVMFITPVRMPARTHFWRKVSAQCVTSGMTMRQRGDAEGTLSFDPLNHEHARLAMKLAGVRPKRLASSTQLANLKKGNRFQKRSDTTIERELLV
jgi:hypothetical protein